MLALKLNGSKYLNSKFRSALVHLTGNKSIYLFCESFMRLLFAHLKGDLKGEMMESIKKMSFCVSRHSQFCFVTFKLYSSAFSFTNNWHIPNFTGAKTMALHPVKWKRTLSTHHTFEMTHEVLFCSGFPVFIIPSCFALLLFIYGNH